MIRSFLLTLTALAVAACSNAPLAPLFEGIGSDFALDRTIERDTAAPVQTDSLVYHLSASGGPIYSVEIPFRYLNDTGRTISIVNCHGGLNMALEKWTGDGWERFFQPVLLMCLSAPIRINPGTVYADTMRIHGAVPGYNTAPAFASDELDGEYRLVWGSLVHAYDPNHSGFGSPLAPLPSNSFLLVKPD